ncbi:phytanoyl-CoA dioxygenase family protein [Brevundimonas diminuta]|jgi:hypothetical protein|uniref:phytanoyl-CoA dioxygenase family protein n=1 Tax=Brevundimonas diminuta TaxID=293 RepID=UPI0019CC07D8|nr:phytanoyl-CoA dioxygenase family protein [Brevundimonas diminuta]MBD3818158.1 phytanoyl-CoA dioxygenase family protein [Brevundimonas diminuta]
MLLAALPPLAELPASDIDRLAARFLDDGYLIIPNAAPAAVFDRVCRELDPHFQAGRFGQGPFYGAETKRFGSVLRRSPSLADLVLDPTLYGVVEAVLGGWCANLQLNLTQAIEIHPGAPVQVPHRDQDMWGGAKGEMQFMVNVMWALDDFTLENGATRVWPGSHRTPQDEMLPEGEAISAVMPRGSALLFLGSTLHSGGANRSTAPRRGLIVSYCLGWLKPWENQWLAYPPAIARTFSPELAALVGYRQHLPSLGNFEGQCPSVLLKGPTPDHLPFSDALREDQNALIAQYYASLEGAPPAGEATDAGRHAAFV